MEKIIHNQTQLFLNDNNILYKYQSGFQKYYLTDTCLSYLNDKVQIGFEQGWMTGMILIDLQKAFDTIDHDILLEKMHCLGFSEPTIQWFRSYLTSSLFSVNLGNEFSSSGKLSCGVPQGSVLGPLLFLMYVNDMPQAVSCELLFYADDTCLICMGKDIKMIEDQLNKDFTSFCEWFIDNKLSIHFGEQQTKSILFGITKRLKNSRNLDIRYKDNEIKQYSKVTYLGCILYNNLSGVAMATKVLGTINGRLKFLYRKQKFLGFSLRRLLCNALIQPHFDYACAAWYPNLNKRVVKKSNLSKQMLRFCLKLKNRDHVGVKEFREINWLPTKERFKQCVCANIFKFFNNMSPAYTSELYKPFNHGHNTQRSNCTLQLPHRNTSYGHKALSFLGPKLWNNLPDKIKFSSNINTFKHDIKKLFFKELQKKDDSVYFYY